MSERGWQAPIQNRRAQSIGELFWIVRHPAFRLGFLDAQHDRPLDHDRILERIETETPAGSLKRLGWNDVDIFDEDRRHARVEVAQYRYEEGRKAVKEYGLRCKAWGHPDFPPAQLRNYLAERAKTLRAELAPVEAFKISGGAVAHLRGEGLPLFRARP